jgi:ribonucrease Y
MSDTVLVVISVAILALLVVLVVTLRRRPQAPSPELGEDLARQLLDRLSAAKAESNEEARPAVDTDMVAREAAELRRSAQLDADRTAAEAMTAAAESRTIAAAQAEEIRRAAREEAAKERAQVQLELERIRGRAESEGRRLGDLARAQVQADREEVQAAQAALRESSARLADEAKRIEGERLAAATMHAESEAANRLVLERQSTVRAELETLRVRTQELDARAQEIETMTADQLRELERIGGLTVDEAKATLLTRMEEQVRREAAIMGRRIEAEAEATAKQRARAIVADAVQRVASDQTAQSVVSVVHLPAEEIKGRIIGREGRNIRTFETVTGVNVIIDDTPEAVLLSCFDPVRREVGRVTLLSLIEDGRIHPHRIEEAYERAKDEVEAQCRRAAEDALLAVGVSELHPELMTLLGHLKYRTSYGQNVLGHMIETAHVARAMGYELGIDPSVLVRGAFLHDIGKALTHEARGSHAIVGAELARHYGESEEVAHCIEAHHDEVAPGTVEAVLTQAADACSGGRPGARRESLESYVQRMERIEAIASAKRGVEKVFAMQAGRELRVMVKPEIVDDIEAHLIAREVAKQIEEELTYPGQVRVTVIRESRATEIAR